jgi:hypothetical protein
MSWDTKKCALFITVQRRAQDDERVSQAAAVAASVDGKDAIACDGVAIVPFWEEAPDSPRTQQARTFGPDGKPLPSTALFQVWSMLTTDLATREDLHPAWRSMCQTVDQLLTKVMEKAAAAAAEPPKAG